ncbi:hypothetical protein BGZ81_003169, partial [Podila clonocystis]
KLGHYYFHANDLVSCAQVCRTWYSVLYPLLWNLYDDSDKVSFFPCEVAQANSRHFRYLTLSHQWPASSPIPNQLSMLFLSKFAIGSAVDLIQANPQLASLDIQLLDGHLFEDIRPGLETLTRLKKLRIFVHGGRDPNSDHVTQFLLCNSGLEKLLVKGTFGGLGLFKGGEPFVHLVELRLNADLQLNPGLVHLITYCPNLRVIRFMVFNNSKCPAMELARILHENCPKLESIRCIEGQNVDITDLIQEREILALLGASSRLIQFEMSIEIFTADIRDALLVAHGQFLELVHIFLDHAVGASMENVGK